MSAVIEKSQLLENTSSIPENQLLERDDEYIPESQLLERDFEGEKKERKKERKKELLKQIDRLEFLARNTRCSSMRILYGDEIRTLRKLLKRL